MDASKRGQKQEAGEVGMVQVATAVIDPRTVVVHLHDAPGRRNKPGTILAAMYKLQ